MCKFVPDVCMAILDKFQEEYLKCPTTPEECRQIEEKFHNRLNVPKLLAV